MKTATNKQAKQRQQKLLGGSSAEMTKLKAKWRKLPDDVRAGWMERFMSAETRPKIREQIRQELAVDLRFDHQLVRFRHWAEDEEARLKMARGAEQKKNEMLAAGMTLAEAQEVILKEATGHSLGERDYSLALKTSSEITKVQNTALNREKFEFNKTEAALKCVDELKAIKRNSTLTDREKLLQARKLLFGHIPEEPKPTT